MKSRLSLEVIVQYTARIVIQSARTKVVKRRDEEGWFLYILECADESLYTGITTDIARRVKEHNAKNGAFYTRNKTPVKLVHQEHMPNQSEASKREAQIKRLTREEKLKLIKR